MTVDSGDILLMFGILVGVGFSYFIGVLKDKCFYTRMMDLESYLSITTLAQIVFWVGLFLVKAVPH